MRRSLYLFILVSLLISACQVTPTPTRMPSPSTAPTEEQALQEPSPTAIPTTMAAPTATATPLPATSTLPQLELPASTATQSKPPTVNLPSIINSGEEPIIVDHTSVALFDQIPEEYLAAARDLRMMYVDASVGWNISEALNCLSSTSWAESPSYCRRDYVPGTWEVKTYGRNELSANQVPARLVFAPSPTQYDRTQWTFVESRGDWNGLARDFMQTLAPEYAENKDVLSFQFNYQHVAGLPGTSIADPQAGFFADTPERYDYADLEAFIAQHPDKIFFHWTTSLARSIGTQESTDFNNQMRDYVRRNGLILFDVADIESHTPTGEPCYDNRDGVEYCDVNGCENFPDDGLDLPAICLDYTSELEGGHLGSGSIGGLQLAKAFWVLMAQIAGWRP
jgi:hypothetical protein